MFATDTRGTSDGTFSRGRKKAVEHQDLHAMQRAQPTQSDAMQEMRL
jgi:hypothetical protein